MSWCHPLPGATTHVRRGGQRSSPSPEGMDGDHLLTLEKTHPAPETPPEARQPMRRFTPVEAMSANTP